MKKTIHVNLGGYSLIMDEDAYHRLKGYLDELSSSLSDDYSEILQDVEARLADIFKEKLSAHVQVVNLEMVESAISAMGKAEDFTGDDPKKKTSEDKPKEKRRRKKLYRDKSNAMLGGVCSGLAEYFDMDISMVRLIMVLLILLGLSIFIYPILWIIMPVKPSYIHFEE